MYFHHHSGDSIPSSDSQIQLDSNREFDLTSDSDSIPSDKSLEFVLRNEMSLDFSDDRISSGHSLSTKPPPKPMDYDTIQHCHLKLNSGIMDHEKVRMNRNIQKSHIPFHQVRPRSQSLSLPNAIHGPSEITEDQLKQPLIVLAKRKTINPYSKDQGYAYQYVYPWQLNPESTPTIHHPYGDRPQTIDDAHKPPQLPGEYVHKISSLPPRRARSNQRYRLENVARHNAHHEYNIISPASANYPMHEMSYNPHLSEYYRQMSRSSSLNRSNGLKHRQQSYPIQYVPYVSKAYSAEYLQPNPSACHQCSAPPYDMDTVFLQPHPINTRSSWSNPTSQQSFLHKDNSFPSYSAKSSVRSRSNLRSKSPYFSSSAQSHQDQSRDPIVRERDFYSQYTVQEMTMQTSPQIDRDVQHTAIDSKSIPDMQQKANPISKPTTTSSCTSPIVVKCTTSSSHDIMTPSPKFRNIRAKYQKKNVFKNNISSPYSGFNSKEVKNSDTNKNECANLNINQNVTTNLTCNSEENKCQNQMSSHFNKPNGNPVNVPQKQKESNSDNICPILPTNNMMVSNKNIIRPNECKPNNEMVEKPSTSNASEVTQPSKTFSTYPKELPVIETSVLPKQNTVIESNQNKTATIMSSEKPPITRMTMRGPPRPTITFTRSKSVVKPPSSEPCLVEGDGTSNENKNSSKHQARTVSPLASKRNLSPEALSVSLSPSCSNWDSSYTYSMDGYAQK